MHQASWTERDPLRQHHWLKRELSALRLADGERREKVPVPDVRISGSQGRLASVRSMLASARIAVSAGNSSDPANAAMIVRAPMRSRCVIRLETACRIPCRVASLTT
jgi:hypothetical protein